MPWDCAAAPQEKPLVFLYTNTPSSELPGCADQTTGSCCAWGPAVGVGALLREDNPPWSIAPGALGATSSPPPDCLEKLVAPTVCPATYHQLPCSDWSKSPLCRVPSFLLPHPTPWPLTAPRTWP